MIRIEGVDVRRRMRRKWRRYCVAQSLMQSSMVEASWIYYKIHSYFIIIFSGKKHLSLTWINTRKKNRGRIHEISRRFNNPDLRGARNKKVVSEWKEGQKYGGEMILLVKVDIRKMEMWEGEDRNQKSKKKWFDR